ncbi:hypothetical protein RvY_18025 [Ramazzottius varieornatus]|uniref:Protein sleepless n=1 Tax=Ramazzottius varieornatus TaxID=947166 RepID=A0A1D1W4A0_RAMVA|nr:hypothetical protein RvY_18025 [Ramazzottius varieornatus]
MAMLTPSLILSLVVLCAVCISQSSAGPYTVSDIQYRPHQCYVCSTVVDDDNQVDTSKAAADSNAFVTRLGATDVYARRPEEGWRFQIVQRCGRWGKGDSIAGGASENCSPRLPTPDGKSLFIGCYCETNDCNDWTYASLKRRCYNLESALMPAMYSNEDYDNDTSIIRINSEAKSIENELCFKCSTYFRQAGALSGGTPMYGISFGPEKMRRT